MGDFGLSPCEIVRGERVVFHSSTVIAVMTFTLNGLADGLGVLYPNFQRGIQSRQKWSSGFGGTFCLDAGVFLYILGVVLILGFGSAEMAGGGALAVAGRRRHCRFYFVVAADRLAAATRMRPERIAAF